MQPALVTLVLAAGFAVVAESTPAQSIEGSVELPKANAERGISSPYQGGPEMAGAPDPPTAVVYLEGVFPIAGHDRPVAQMTQKNLNFGPGILPIQVGTAVEFPNLDDTYHNVFSYSKAKRFDLGRYRKDEKPGSVLFDKPGVVTTHCEVHEKMRGTILVLETPYFQKTDSEGHYHLDHLPAGHYVLTAWCSEKDIRNQEVELKANATQRVDFLAK